MQRQQRRISRGVMIITALTIVAAPAKAQETPQLPIGILDGSRLTPPQRPRPRPLGESASKDVPAWEVGIQGGLWDLMGSDFAGGRIARNFGNWLGIEAFADGRHATAAGIASYRLAGANLRFSTHLPTKLGMPYWAYLIVGAATSSGLGYGYSPLIGGGVQTAWVGPIAFRAELQRFTRGATVSNDGRLLVGAAIGFGQ